MISNKEAIKNAALAEKGYLQMLLHAHLALVCQHGSFPPLTVRWLSQPTLSDNATLVPTPLYDMSSQDSSIDRQKDIVEMRR